MKWQEIWQTGGAAKLWTVPDRHVIDVINGWKGRRDIRRVLDVGCGLGRHSHLLASGGFEVYGLDHAEEAISRCRSWMEEDGYEGTFWCGELDDIPQEDGYFDAIIAFNSIYHGDRTSLSRVIRTLSARLRPGGQCFVTLPSRQSRLYGKGEEVAPHTFLSEGAFPGLFEHDGERGVPHYFSSREDISEFFEGFSVDALEHQELHLATVSKGSGELRWLRIRNAFFWYISATRL